MVMLVLPGEKKEREIKRSAFNLNNYEDLELLKKNFANRKIFIYRVHENYMETEKQNFYFCCTKKILKDTARNQISVLAPQQ